MLRFTMATALCGLAILYQITAQRFSNLQLLFDRSGISDGCSDALNTTVSYPSFLIGIAIAYVSFIIHGQHNMSNNVAF
jgi:hypothetical protein